MIKLGDLRFLYCHELIIIQVIEGVEAEPGHEFLALSDNCTREGFVHISAGIMDYFSYLGINRTFLYCSCINQTMILVFLTLGVTLLVVITEIPLVLSY